MKEISIYALINPINGHVFYIGATEDITRRIKEHTKNKYADFEKEKIVKEILDNGMDIDFEVLDTCSKEEAYKLEEFYIHLFKSYGYYLPQTKLMTYFKYKGDYSFEELISKRFSKDKIEKMKESYLLTVRFQMELYPSMCRPSIK